MLPSLPRVELICFLSSSRCLEFVLDFVAHCAHLFTKNSLTPPCFSQLSRSEEIVLNGGRRLIYANFARCSSSEKCSPCSRFTVLCGTRCLFVWQTQPTGHRIVCMGFLLRFRHKLFQHTKKTRSICVGNPFSHLRFPTKRQGDSRRSCVTFATQQRTNWLKLNFERNCGENTGGQRRNGISTPHCFALTDFLVKYTFCDASAAAV